VLDSGDAATGVCALRRQPDLAVLDIVQAVQRAWFVDGRSLSDPHVWRDIAAELGADPDAVSAALRDPGTRAQASGEFQQVRVLGVRHFPSVLLHDRTGVHRLGGALSTSESLTEALRRYPGMAAA
jgi:putative protein-disulfide isomerase